MKGNAVLISRQIRKYVAAIKFPLILIYDDVELVCLKFSEEERNLWGTTASLQQTCF